MYEVQYTQEFIMCNMRWQCVLQYEGLVSPNLRRYVSYMLVYECQGIGGAEFETYVRGKGHVCYQATMLPILSNYCNNLVIAWGTGSEVSFMTARTCLQVCYTECYMFLDC